jgi:nitrate reductase gamma subunit
MNAEGNCGNLEDILKLPSLTRYSPKFHGCGGYPGAPPFQLSDSNQGNLSRVAHFLMLIGCCLLLLGTALDVISHYAYDFILGNVYFAHSLFTDIGGTMALVGVIMAAVRRYGQRPERLDNRREDLWAMVAIGSIILTGFIVEGLRIAATEMVPNPGWAGWSPGGWLVAKAFAGISQDSLLVLHRVWWWIHSVLTFGFLVYIAARFNRLWHIVISPLNVFWRKLGPREL